MSTTLVVAGLLHVLMAAAFFYVGARLRERQVAPEVRGPMLGLAVWWVGLAGSTAVTAVLDLLGAAGRVDAAFFLALEQTNLWLVVAALAGLMYYLVYLFTGRRALPVVVVFYVVVLVVLLYNMAARGPTGVELRAWDTDLAYANPERVPGPIVFLLVLFPPLAGAAGMLGMVRRAPGPTQRFRLLLLGGSILVWFGALLVAGVGGGLATHPAYGFVARLLALAVAAAAYVAYFPPAWAQRRWGVEGLRPPPRGGGPTALAPATPPALPEARASALDAPAGRG